jgi:hypothetical protein
MTPFTSTRKLYFLCAVLSALLFLTTASSPAGGTPQLFGRLTLRSETVRAFNTYLASTDQKNSSTLNSGNFLWVDDLESSERQEAYEKLKRGDVVMRHINASGGTAEVSGGMIHDWEGAVFIPGTKLQAVLAILQDYDHHATYFAPDVESARIEARDGDHFRVFMRFRRTNVITVVLNTEQEITYFRDSPGKAHSRSSAVRIAEVENPGGKPEKENPPGKDNGFLWRMETWWRLQEKDGGVYLQSQAVSLTREIPSGLAWAVEPFVTTIPKESLEFTLQATRKAVFAPHNK